MYPQISGPSLIFGRGMISDDTEQACMVAQALIVSGGDVEAFRQNLGWQFRLWLLGLPAAPPCVAQSSGCVTATTFNASAL